MYWGRSESLNIKHKSYTHNYASHSSKMCDFITRLQGSIPRQLLGRENCPMNLNMLSIYLVSPKCSPIFGIIAMTLKDIYSLLAAVGDLKHLILKAQLTRCYKFGGFCHYNICPGNSRFMSNCHPENLRCCKNIKQF